MKKKSAIGKTDICTIGQSLAKVMKQSLHASKFTSKSASTSENSFTPSTPALIEVIASDLLPEIGSGKSFQLIQSFQVFIIYFRFDIQFKNTCSY